MLGNGDDRGDGGDSPDGEPSSSEDDNSGSGDSGDNEGDGEQDASGGSEGDSPEETLDKARQQAAQFMQAQGEGALQKPQDVEGLVNAEIQAFFDWSTENDPDRYIVFSEEYDDEIEFALSERLRYTSEYAKIKQDVLPHIGTLANVLEMHLAAETESRWVGGERRGKVFDRRRLTHWLEGGTDDRIFRYRVDGEKIDTAVTMLWDCSGSMYGRKVELARIAAVAFHEALNRCRPMGIEHEILGFNTGGPNSPEVAAMAQAAAAAGDDLDKYSRIDERDNRWVYVPFGERDGRALASIHAGDANRDAECVLWAAKRLARRNERRKILIVGSDGRPAGARYHRTEEQYLREVVQQVIGAGIEVYGIGIMDDSVADFYPEFEFIHNVKDLPRAVLQQLLRRFRVGHGNDARSTG